MRISPHRYADFLLTNAAECHTIQSGTKVSKIFSAIYFIPALFSLPSYQRAERALHYPPAARRHAEFIWGRTDFFRPGRVRIVPSVGLGIVRLVCRHYRSALMGAPNVRSGGPASEHRGVDAFSARFRAFAFINHFKPSFPQTAAFPLRFQGALAFFYNFTARASLFLPPPRESNPTRPAAAAADSFSLSVPGASPVRGFPTSDPFEAPDI